MATEVAVCGSVLSSLIWRWAFSMTTIASSTTRPVARVMPKSVSELIEKPKTLMKANVPISDTGIVTAGIMVARQSSRKRKITMMTMMIASSSVLTTSFTESPTTVVVSKAITYLMPGGNDFRKLDQRSFGGLVNLERIGIRQLLHTDADGFVPAVHQDWCHSSRRRFLRVQHL